MSRVDNLTEMVYNNCVHFYREVVMNVKIRSTVLLFLTAIIWGFAFVAQRAGADHLGSFSYNAIRYALGALSLVPVVLIFERDKPDKAKIKRTVLFSVLTGIIMFSAVSLQQFGIVITNSVGKASFITGLYTVLVPIFAMFIGKRTRVNTWIGALLAIGGLYFLCFEGTGGIGIGDVLLLACSALWAMHILVVDTVVEKISPLKFSMIQFFVCSALCFICAFIFEDITPGAVSAAAIPILYGGIMSVGIAYTCQILGQKGADPTYSAIILSTESVFGAIGGALLLNEKMNEMAGLGCALIFAGILVSQLNFKEIIEKCKAKKK